MGTPSLTVWGPGQIFAFSGIDGATDFDRGIVAQSSETGFFIRQPGAARLEVGRVTAARFGSDWADLETGAGPVRLAFASATCVIVEGAADLVHLDPEREFLDVTRRADRMIIRAIGCGDGVDWPDMDELQRARQRWVGSHAQKVAGDHATLGLKALNQMKGMVYAPEGQIARPTATPDRYPHKEIWLWDSVFHALGYRHLDPDLARDMVLAVLDQQDAATGRIGISFGPYARRMHRSQPPLLAWGVEQVASVTPDQGWVEEAIPKLRNYLKWFEDHRKLDGLFAWVGDDGSLGSVCDESGMDNSPRFASGAPCQAVDLSCYMAQEYRAMANLDPGGHWEEKARDLEARIDGAFWDEGLAFYCDRDIGTGHSTGVEAVTGFLPLLLGDLPAGRVEALSRAATDPDRFGTKLPLPSIARRHPDYAPDMWKGPVWVNFNWMIARGFRAHGETVLAERLREGTLRALQDQYRATGSIFEYYDADGRVLPPKLLRKGRTDPVIDPARPSIHMVIHDYGWSATLALDWILRGEP